MHQLTKRALDMVVSALALLLLAPLMVVVAIAVRLSSPGPVFFRQRRIGRWGDPFWLYKFRTMRPDAGGPFITAAGDERVTVVGHWLRYWKLDELPQLFNVLRGDMSLVGPRPQVPKYVCLYNEEQEHVLSVRPGITGPCQVWLRHEERLLAAQPDPETYYITTLLPEKLALDLEYVRHPSLLADLRILTGTVLAICRPTAAATQPLPAEPAPTAAQPGGVLVSAGAVGAHRGGAAGVPGERPFPTEAAPDRWSRRPQAHGGVESWEDEPAFEKRRVGGRSGERVGGGVGHE
jgi:lipopolysaccharide/colanic/teichoic acid biosynthesis glycosyltransferase